MLSVVRHKSEGRVTCVGGACGGNVSNAAKAMLTLAFPVRCRHMSSHTRAVPRQSPVRPGRDGGGGGRLLICPSVPGAPGQQPH